MSGPVGRFAPSTTGPAHPGTLLAALLGWLDARIAGGRIVLRLEDLDPERSRPAWVERMVEDLAWLGLDWDTVERQSERAASHAEALEQLATDGLLYPCICSRARVREAGQLAPDGGWRYPGTCRERTLPADWRERQEAIRLRLQPGRVACRDESGLDLGADPFADHGDPVVRRRDGAVAYHLASVVDDAASEVTRVVRGRDLAGTTALQIRLRELLGLAIPTHRHHLLLLERHGGKLAKLHGSVDAAALRARYDAPSLCGVLAHAAGLRPAPDAVRPADLLADFSWNRVSPEDRLLDWDGRRLCVRDR